LGVYRHLFRYAAQRVALRRFFLSKGETYKNASASLSVTFTQADTPAERIRTRTVSPSVAFTVPAVGRERIRDRVVNNMPLVLSMAPTAVRVKEASSSMSAVFDTLMTAERIRTRSASSDIAFSTTNAGERVRERSSAMDIVFTVPDSAWERLRERGVDPMNLVLGFTPNGGRVRLAAASLDGPIFGTIQSAEIVREGQSSLDLALTFTPAAERVRERSGSQSMVTTVTSGRERIRERSSAMATAFGATFAAERVRVMDPVTMAVTFTVPSINWERIKEAASAMSGPEFTLACTAEKIVGDSFVDAAASLAAAFTVVNVGAEKVKEGAAPLDSTYAVSSTGRERIRERQASLSAAFTVGATEERIRSRSVSLPTVFTQLSSAERIRAATVDELTLAFTLGAVTGEKIKEGASSMSGPIFDLTASGESVPGPPGGDPTVADIYQILE
jgi:hypothetical protein